MGEGEGPHCVVSFNTGYVYGVGEGRKHAIEDASRWIEDEVSDEVSTWTSLKTNSMHLPDYAVYPCTQELVDSVLERGGHTDWTTANGVVVYTEGIEDPVQCFGCGTIVDATDEETRAYDDDGRRLVDVFLCEDYPGCGE